MRKIAVAALGLAAIALLAQTGAPGVRTGAWLAVFRSGVDDSDQSYALYVPKSFDPARKYPLVISLHAEESNHRLNLRRIFGVASRLGEPDTEDMRYFPRVADVDFIVAAPSARGSMGYQGIAEKDVYDVLADVERRFPIDPDRVYLTGVSMGGAGALWLALTRPGVWAAVAPVCPVAAPPGTDEFAPNALDLPIRIFQGDQDPVVPVESARAWHRKFLDFGVPADYVEYPGVRHNAWDLAYRNGAIFDWFSRFRRNRRPDRVRFVTRSYRYPSAYWLRIDGLTPGVPAAIDAVWTGNAALKVETRNLDGFTVTVEQVSEAPVTVTIDGVPLRVKPAAALSFTRAPLPAARGRSGPSAPWRPGLWAPPANAKRPGVEGPISEAVSSRQIYVYGTTGAAAEELEARRKLAETAARWSTARSRLSLSFPVKPDTAVTPADLDSADVILFGTSQTNALIARLAPGLPLALSPGAADYGLLFVFPIGKHYALVSSGLPWWTGADEVDRGGDPMAPPQYRLLSTLGDFVLFKGSLANVVSEGRFERNWKVPADASARMQATGTVTVH